MSTVEDRLQELETAYAGLQHEVQTLRARNRTELGGSTHRPLSRRDLLLGAGAIAGVATVSALGLTPGSALATDGQAVIAGQSNTDTASTAITGSVLTGPALLASNYFSGSYDNYADAFQAYVYGAGLAAVYGRNDAGGGAGMIGYSASGTGGVFTGGQAPLCLQPASSAGPPTSNNHQQGELFVDANGALWICTKSGTPSTPGTFTQVATTDSFASYGQAALVKPPSSSTFSWVNQGAARATDESDGLYMYSPHLATSGDTNVMLVKAVPATPYTLIVGYLWWQPLINVAQMGLVLRQSSTGTFVSFVQACDFSQSPIGQEWAAHKWNSATSWNSTYGLVKPASWTRLQWLRVNDDGTNRTLSVSPDGVHFVQLYQMSHTDFASPDQIGITINTSQTSYDCWMKLLSWSVTQP